MDYKEKVIALLNSQELSKEQKEKLESIFPELKKSTDEDIKKEIIAVFKGEIPYTSKEDAKKYINWLEKQGEVAYNPYKETVKSIANMCDKYATKMNNEEDANDFLQNVKVKCKDAIEFEKQSEKDSCIGCTNDKGCVTCENGNLKEIKSETKFHHGDWVILNDTVALILDKQKYGFVCLDIDGKEFFCNYGHIDSMHHWTIRDAKDSDILVAKDGRPFIFTGKFDAQDGNPTAYCGINSDNKFITGKGSHWTFKDGITPATKEQRDLLFQKMKEAGYVWDADKKELKKIEPKFHPGDWIIRNAEGFRHNAYLVKEIKDYYVCEDLKGRLGTFTFNDVHNNFKLWDISDAKDGDVLVSDDVIFIFNNIHGVWVNCHCSLCKERSFNDRNYDLAYVKDSKEVYPATKEQCDTLFAKMKESGYVWDDDKKELRKMEVVSKENDGEKIRKDLIEYLKTDMECNPSQYESFYKKSIAWLEKQTDKPNPYSGTSFEYNGHTWGMCARDNGVDISLDKQLLKHLEMQSEQKPADNIKPKFNFWDFITNGYCLGRVIVITDDAYLLDTGQGIPLSCENTHLWTVADAKDGDVLVNGYNIFIFHYIDDIRLMGYCHVNTYDGRFYDDIGKNECFCLIDAEVNPATKEQRDLLFRKMKAAGYVWDDEKKELSKKQTLNTMTHEEKELLLQDLEWFDMETNECHCYNCELFDHENNVCKCIDLCKNPKNTYKGFYVK